MATVPSHPAVYPIGHPYTRLVGDVRNPRVGSRQNGLHETIYISVRFFARNFHCSWYLLGKRAFVLAWRMLFGCIDCEGMPEKAGVSLTQ